MKYHLTENLEDRQGVVSNLHCFLYRHLDTGFKTKWDGMWAPPFKFLDYYAIRVNGIWLNGETVEATDYGEKMKFYHELDTLRIIETISAPKTCPGIKINLKIVNKTDEIKAVHLSVEPGIDIRHKSQDVPEGSYETELGPNRLTIGRNDKKIMITSDIDFNLEENQHYKEHYPGERQVCFIPGKIGFKNEIENEKNIKIEFSTSKGSFGDIEDVEQELEGENLERLFNSSIESLKNLTYDRDGVGVIAGHPWFQAFWARDTFWSVLGIIDAGLFNLAEDILTTFAERGLPDRISLENSMENLNKFPRCDTAPLFVIAADKLRRHYKLNEEINSKLEDIKEDIDELELEDGVIQHDPEGTWMDTIKRKNAVDVQSLWIKASEILDHDIKEDLEQGLEKFTEEDYMKDCLGENCSKTINPCIPLMFDQIGEEKSQKYIETVNAEFLCRYGARTRSLADPGYNSSGYHTGSTWGLTTCWAAAANFEHGNYKQGKNLIKNLQQFLDRNQPGALPEVVDSESGDLIGCSEQAWSAGTALHVIDSYLIGIKVQDNDKVKIRPIEDLDIIRKGKKVKNEEIDIKVSDGKAKILNNPDIDIEIEER